VDEMTAIDTIENLMKSTGTTFAELAEYAGLGSKENVYQMLKRQDLKVGTFVRLLEVLGFQLVVQGVESSEEIVMDYEGV